MGHGLRKGGVGWLGRGLVEEMWSGMQGVGWGGAARWFINNSVSRWYLLTMAESPKLFALGVRKIEHLDTEPYYRSFWKKGKPCLPTAEPRSRIRFRILEDAGTHDSRRPAGDAGAPDAAPPPPVEDDPEPELDLEDELLRVMEAEEIEEEPPEPDRGARPVDFGGASGSGGPGSDGPAAALALVPPVPIADAAASERGGGEGFAWVSPQGHNFRFKAIMKGPADARSIGSWQCTCRFHPAHPANQIQGWALGS